MNLVSELRDCSKCSTKMSKLIFSDNSIKAPLVLPPGMSIEQKTEFLSNLDPKHQFFISMPHMNAGKFYEDYISTHYLIFNLGVLPLHTSEPLDLYPPLKKKNFI